MDNKQFEMMLADAEVRLDRLKSLYEQWFQGIERLEPLIPRKNLDRQVSLLRREKPRNTRLRFRLQVLIQRYTTYMSYWQRVSRQIEEGSYRRDVLRVRKQRSEARKQRELEIQRRRELDATHGISTNTLPPEEDSLNGELNESLSIPSTPSSSSMPLLSSSKPPTIRSISPFALPSIPSPSSPSSSSPHVYQNISSKQAAPMGIPNPKLPDFPEDNRSQGTPNGSTKADSQSQGPNENRTSTPSISPKHDEISDMQIRKIYDRYLYARIKNKESTENIKIEKLAKSMRAIIPELKKKHKGKIIDFQVVIKNGRVALKPVVK